MATLPRRIAGTLITLLALLFTTLGLAGPAQAEDGYQYWHYLHLQDDGWAMGETGPADHVADDGDLEGFRFGTSTMAQPIEPRTDSDEITFEAVCEGIEAGDGEKRVAVVLDFGDEADAGTPPENRAECAVGEESASTQELLQTVVDVRLEGGMACALDGHPATGCGVSVPDVQVPTEEDPVSFTLTSAPDDATAVEENGDGATGAEQAEDPDEWKGIAAILLVFALVAASSLLMRRRAKRS